jgi:hypothetical protein
MKTEIKFVSFIDGPEWAHFLWHVDINGQVFQYKTGVGHATPFYKKIPYSGWNRPMNKKPDRNTVRDNQGERWVHVPHIDEILYCLFSDADAATEPFDEFCLNFGYNSDSIKVLNIYQECTEIKNKLRIALGSEYSEIKSRIEEREF